MPHGQDAYQRVLARQILRLLDLQHVRYEIADADDEQGGPRDKKKFNGRYSEALACEKA